LNNRYWIWGQSSWFAGLGRESTVESAIDIGQLASKELMRGNDSERELLIKEGALFSDKNDRRF